MAANVERKTIDKSALEKIPILWVIGGPGAGKGTQCEQIALKYKFTHLSSGDLLRSEVMSGSNRGLQLYKLMANGELAPNAVVDDILAEAMIEKSSASKGFLIDGFPISLDQAESFVKDIKEPTCLLILEANDEVLKGRLKGRANFDDTEDSIKNRIITFNEQTRPVINKFTKIAKIVNAERKPDEVWADVDKFMAELTK